MTKLASKVGSRWVPSGLVGARRGSVWVRILVVHRYGSIESSVRARRVPSGHIGHIGQSSVRSKNIKYGPKWVENRRFGPKQKPNEPNRLSGPIRTTPEAKNGQKKLFLRKRPPAAPADLGGPPHSYRRRPGPTYISSRTTVPLKQSTPATISSSLHSLIGLSRAPQ